MRPNFQACSAWRWPACRTPRNQTWPLKAGLIWPTTLRTRCALQRCAGMATARATDSIVFQLLPHTLGLGPEVWRVLSKCHDARNLGEYEGMLEVDTRLVTDLITACKQVADKLGALPPLTSA